MQQLGFIDSRKRLAVRKTTSGEHMGSLQHIIVCIALKQLSLFLFERGDGGYLPIKRPIRGLLTRQCADCPPGQRTPVGVLARLCIAGGLGKRHQRRVRS